MEGNILTFGEELSQSQSGPRFRGLGLVLAFVAGLVLGWVVIGWWLWPMRWTNAEPWHLRSEHQRAYVALVAERYGRTGEAPRAREALDDWDAEDLGRLLAAMQSQADTSDERQRLAALAEVVVPPEEEAARTEAESLMSKKGFMVGIFLSVSPLLLAVILAVSPLMRGEGLVTEEPSGQGMGQAAAKLEEEFDKLLSGEEEEKWGYEWPDFKN